MPTWTPALALGVDAIDAQHQELFKRTDALLAAMRAGNSVDQVKPLLQFLDEYCAEHFASEEQLMRARAYPGLKDHQAQHAHFTQEFQKIVAQFQAKGPAVTVSLAVQQLVCGWLVRHIGSVDRQLAGFLSAGARAAG